MINFSGQCSEPTCRTLKDGRCLEIRLAREGDISTLVREHPAPRVSVAHVNGLATYYEAKCLMYVRARNSGIVTGWVGDQLVGFVFFTADTRDLKRFMRSPKFLGWTVKRALLGDFGFDPRKWLAMARWCLQHFRSPKRRANAGGRARGPVSEKTVDAWIGTVHTVEGFRGIGVAGALMEFAESELTRRGARTIGLWAGVDNEAALRLYEKRGYERVCVVPRIGEDCWLMVKTIG